MTKKRQKISTKILKDLRDKIIRDRSRDFRETSKYRNKRKVWIDQLEGRLQSKKNTKSWESDLSLPITSVEVDIIATRHYQALTEHNNTFLVKPTSAEDVFRAQKIEKWINWYLNNYLIAFKERLEKGIRVNTYSGLNIFYIYYKRDVQPIEYTRKFKFQEPVTDYYSKALEIISKEYEDNLIDIKEKGSAKFEVKYNRKTPIDSINEQIEDIAIWDFYFEEELFEEQLFIKEIEVDIKENNIEYDGVVIENVSIDNFWCPANVEDNYQLQKCDHLGREFTTNFSDVKRAYKDGTYDLLTKEDLKLLEKVQYEEDETTPQVKTTNKENAGITESFETDLTKNIIGYECYYYYDINDDGYNEHIRIIYIKNINKIASIRSLNKVFKHGKRPFVATNYIPREGTIFSIGLCELLHELQKEIDILHNQYINNNELVNTPWGLVRGGSSFAKRLEKNQVQIKPGYLFTTDDPQRDINFPNFGTNLSWTLTDISIMRSQAQEAAGSNSMMRGEQQHSRTPVGTSLKLLAEANMRVRQTLERLNFGIREMLIQIYQLVRDYGPQEQVFRVMGKDSNFHFNKITKDDLKNIPDFELGTSLNNLNKVYLRESYIMLFQQIVNPVLIQSGIIQKGNIYNMLEKLFSTYDITDIEKLITKPPENKVESQEEELWKIVSGEKIYINPLDNHKEHLSILRLFKEAETYDEAKKHNIPFIGLLEPEYRKYVELQIQEHTEALQQEIMQQQIMAQELAKQQEKGQLRGDTAQQPGDQSKQQSREGSMQRPKTNPMMPTGGNGEKI